MRILLNTKRLTLRPIGSEDLYTTHCYAGNPENARFMIYLPNDDIGETKAFLEKAWAQWNTENPSFYEFAIDLAGKHIGAVGLYLNELRTVGELGWILHKAYWAKGYCTEAAMAVKEFALKELKLTELVAHCDSENIASARVMEKLGLTLEDDTQKRRNKCADRDSIEYKYSLRIDCTERA